jgi:hypothetical protein
MPFLNEGRTVGEPAAWAAAACIESPVHDGLQEGLGLPCGSENCALRSDGNAAIESTVTQIEGKNLTTTVRAVLSEGGGTW